MQTEIECLSVNPQNLSRTIFVLTSFNFEVNFTVGFNVEK